MSVQDPTTFLDLVQRLSFECGIAGPGPSSVLSQTGQNQDLVNWTAASWTEIQKKHTDWSFMLHSSGETPIPGAYAGTAFVTVPGQVLYTPTECGIARGVVGQWKRDTFRNFQNSSPPSNNDIKTEVFMDYIPYDRWRDTYQYAALRLAQIRPIAFTIAPNYNIGLATPLGIYTVIADYYEAPLAFAADADEPSVPNQHILVIVYKAMMKYAAFENAPEVYNRGEEGYKEHMRDLERERLPEAMGPGALA